MENDLKPGTVVIFLTNAYRDEVPEGSVGIVLNDNLDVQVSTDHGTEMLKGLRPDEIRPATNNDLRDGEVLGVDCEDVVQWDATQCLPYNSGETLDEFGYDNLTEAERKRVLK